MKATILLGYRLDLDKQGIPLHSYARSTHRVLEEMGHEVIPVGPGHALKNIDSVPEIVLRTSDLFLDIDCGRDKTGRFSFYCEYSETKKLPVKTAVRFIDTHGNPSLHRRMGKKYDHVFFAVWDKRDLFADHPSAHWCPNASDDKWFDYKNHSDKYEKPQFKVGFFSSKDGLSRADDLKRVCDLHHLEYDIREIGSYNRQRWPMTAEAMANCLVLFNRGQKHDGPNQRVIESMLMARPLVSDRDDRDGMNKLFKEGDHYLAYDSRAELANHLQWCFYDYGLALSMALRAYEEVKEKHLIKHRIEQILEVCLSG